MNLSCEPGDYSIQTKVGQRVFASWTVPWQAPEKVSLGLDERAWVRVTGAGSGGINLLVWDHSQADPGCLQVSG